MHDPVPANEPRPPRTRRRTEPRGTIDPGPLERGALDIPAGPRVDVFDADARAREPGTATPIPEAQRRLLTEGETTIELREEQLVAQKDLRDVGEIVVRTEVEEVPGRLEVEALREEVEVEHVPVGEVVRERREPWEEGDVLVVPVYEEQLVVSRRLVLREHLRIRRVATTERRLFQDTLRRERLVIEDPQGTGLVRERYPTDPEVVGRPDDDGLVGEDHVERRPGGFFESLVRKALS